MVLRVARQGANAGNQFWGCSEFPNCKGTVNIGDSANRQSAESPAPKKNSKTLFPVEWTFSAPHPHFEAEHITIGSLAGILPDPIKTNGVIRQILSQSVILMCRDQTETTTLPDAQFSSELIVKTLQRGEAPPPTLEIEKVALETYGFRDKVRDLSDEGRELGWELQERKHVRWNNPRAILGALINKVPFAIDPAFHYREGSEDSLLQSEAEAKFFLKWVPRNLPPSAGHWLTPQASLDRLLESRGIEEGGTRRVDFLFCHPGCDPFVVEIDGGQHASQERIDTGRDASLRAAGVEVIRVTSQEVEEGHGPRLDQIRERCLKALTAFGTESASNSKVDFIMDCSIASKVQFAVARAIQNGFLKGESWKIRLIGVGAVAGAGVLDILRLLTSLDTLYGENSSPSRCTVHSDDGFSATWVINQDQQWHETVDGTGQDDDVCIAVESMASPFHAVNSQADFIIRPAFVPVRFDAFFGAETSRRAVAPARYEDVEAALTVFLQNVFRKYQFQPLQGEAVFKVLRQVDCAVLLPTGAGKSLIYQLAGLLMPGVTLIVDPIVALIEDQVESLHAYGIDRATSITSADTRSGAASRRLVRQIERGNFHFIFHTPERMQSPTFREALRALRLSTLINLAVIDEAHCVSEWGHDFRPAYLSLGDNLREYCKDSEGRPPPILGLTGTASRAVLRDMLVALRIDRVPDSLVRADSFDRTELNFGFVRILPDDDPKAVLRGVLNSLPRKFRKQELFVPAGRETASGIVFVPTVNGRDNGVTKIDQCVRDVTGAETTIYSGKPPRGISGNWDEIKRSNAKKFKDNKATLIVTTKAFGMGIDKPNIRYTVHVGMPGSLESFYQEAGRAGRDRRPAQCTVIFNEFDPHRSDQLLSPDIDLEELRERHNKFEKSGQSDDVMLALWFHLKGFEGKDQAVKDVGDVLRQMGDLSSRKKVELPINKNFFRDRLEKAIYRLFRVGVIRTYEDHFGSNKLVVSLDAFDLERCKNRLLEYVHASQPAKSKKFAHELEEIDSEDSAEAAFRLTEKLIEFTYDVIERSRRMMIQESVRLARQAENDEDIRRRLLDYLQEGLGATQIEELIDDADIDLNEWWKLTSKLQTPMDAGELRGLCIRALESYPDHPGLLMTRAVSEAMCEDHDSDVSSQGISAAIVAGIQKYDLQLGRLVTAINNMFDLAIAREPELGMPLIMALLRIPDSISGTIVEKGLERASEFNTPDFRAALAVHKFREIGFRLENVANKMAHQYEVPGIGQTLCGSTE